MFGHVNSVLIDCRIPIQIAVDRCRSCIDVSGFQKQFPLLFAFFCISMHQTSNRCFWQNWSNRKQTPREVLPQRMSGQPSTESALAGGQSSVHFFQSVGEQWWQAFSEGIQGHDVHPTYTGTYQYQAKCTGCSLVSYSATRDRCRFLCTCNLVQPISLCVVFLLLIFRGFCTFSAWTNHNMIEAMLAMPKVWPKVSAQPPASGVGRASPGATGQEAVDRLGETYPLAQGILIMQLSSSWSLKLIMTHRTNSACNRKRCWFVVLSALWGPRVCLCFCLWVTSYWIAWKVPVSKLLDNRPDLLGFCHVRAISVGGKVPIDSHIHLIHQHSVILIAHVVDLILPPSGRCPTWLVYKINSTAIQE